MLKSTVKYSNLDVLASVSFARITFFAFRVDPFDTHCHVEPNSSPLEISYIKIFLVEMSDTASESATPFS